MSNEQPKTIPDYLSVSFVPRADLEQWYINMSYVCGLLLFHYGTELPNGNRVLRISREQLLNFAGFHSQARLFFSEDLTTQERVIELRKWNS